MHENDIEEMNVTEEGTENVDTATTEETAGEANEEQKTEQETSEETAKLYTQQELDDIVERRLARERAKLHKKYEKQAALADVVKAGTGTDYAEAEQKMREYYQSKGIDIPSKSTYSDNDTKILAEAEAKVIINAGYDEVVAELEDLRNLGVDKMDARQKEKFKILATHQKQEARVKELASIGVPELVYESKEFKDFAAQFNDDTPMKTVYELYIKTSSTKPQPEKLGSMKNTHPQGDMDIYTPEEVDKLTAKDYDNPKIMEKVRRSMIAWGK